MKVQTKSFGEIEIQENDIITIIDGIFGFPNKTKYIMLMKKEEEPFGWLQSLDDPNLAFVIIPPQVFRVNYKLKIGEEYLKKINVETTKDVVTYAIVVVPADPQKMTANLQGPIVISPKTKLGCQAISNNPKHLIRHYIMEEMAQLQEQQTENKDNKISD